MPPVCPAVDAHRTTLSGGHPCHPSVCDLSERERRRQRERVPMVSRGVPPRLECDPRASVQQPPRRLEGLGFRLKGSGFRILRFLVQGLGFRAPVLRFMVES